MEDLAEDYNEAGYPKDSPALVRIVLPLLERLDELLGDWEEQYFSSDD